MMRSSKPRALAFALLLAACAGGSASAPPPPLRPTPAKDLARPAVPTDCEATVPELEMPAKEFDQRSIPEGEKLARQALGKLQTAESTDVDQVMRENLITEAVDDFITALLADPYNVTATYNLAAAYARIGRRQCSLNLLSRLLQLRNHGSKRAEVDSRLDRLLGRNRSPLDPDFNQMRSDNRFRALIEKMCDGTNDKDCVYGK